MIAVCYTYQGNAQYSLTIDGKVVRTTGTVTAPNASGQPQVVTVQAALTAGTHDLGVSFLNDAWGGTPSSDRNLYVKGFDVNGTPATNATAALYNESTVHFSFLTS